MSIDRGVYYTSYHALGTHAMFSTSQLTRVSKHPDLGGIILILLANLKFRFMYGRIWKIRSLFWRFGASNNESRKLFLSIGWTLPKKVSTFSG